MRNYPRLYVIGFDELGATLQIRSLFRLKATEASPQTPFPVAGAELTGNHAAVSLTS